MKAFPRLKGRDLIEAGVADNPITLKSGFPRLKGRDLIEACVWALV